ncbi:MAG TPA: MotA/TolQ/ExbB proton channel family protein [Candidatus Marinimicrobia bacterium]|nr:MotA/TolQ/ExbB proton channel family protein [Candidatus Neomarinimicrobiota bacterium]HRS50813.1 MotA/TolQ/ExbB proton channel family protein [Candidatus Neomarinimicrobiota bacterium]HRU91846.1 MotA/TolQ/ExbB proton channel family protein [Candidatus Neomarinimicrobiota bacterium]
MKNIFTSTYDIGVMGWAIILILIALSIIAWGIIIEKIILFRRTGKQNQQFLAIYHSYSSWSNVEKETRHLKFGLLPNLFRKIYAEVHKDVNPNPGDMLTDTKDAGVSHASSIELYKALVDTVINTELIPYERRLIFLSSTVTASPFLGLFGTVWGLMQAFLSIGVKGSAAIAAIGPGIAEALVTTVVGLAVAIPVLFGYNLIVDKIRKYENQMQIFGNDMIQKIIRENSYGRSPL